MKAPRNSCSASWARAGVVHQNDGGELRTGMRRDLMRRRVLDGLMPGCRGCASFRGGAISGAGYHYQCSHLAAMQGSQAALMSPRWAASRRVLRGSRWYCQTRGCNVMRQACPSDGPMLELMMLFVGRSWEQTVLTCMRRLPRKRFVEIMFSDSGYCKMCSKMNVTLIFTHL